MGCCYSFFCKEDTASQSGEPNERTHLLVDPVSNTTTIQRVNSEDLLQDTSNAQPKKTDEQSALNKILHETATNVIDVAALDSHNLQQHEYMERMKQYNQKINQVFATNKIQCKGKSCILQDVPNPEKILNSDPVHLDDIKLISQALARANVAVKEIKVEHKEDLVVPFRIP